MKKNIRALTVCLVVLSLSACSIAPGIPGLKNSSSKNGDTKYKLVVIDAAAIRNQKPFDYTAYIKEKKKRGALYSSKSGNIYTSQPAKKASSSRSLVNRSHARPSVNSKNFNDKQSGVSAVANQVQFEGVTAKDSKSNYKYFLGKGDVLSITVWDHPELTAPSENNAFGGHIIDDDGRFYFPYSGKINAAGKTIRNVRDELETKLGSFITKPQVSVSITRFRSQKVYTSGAVEKPTTLMVEDTPMTVRDAISKSGGLISNQYTGYATLARKGKNISIDLNRMLKHNDNRQNFILGNGDRLHIVERTELGEFNRRLNLDIRKENTLSSVRLRNEINSIRALGPVRLKIELDKERSIARLKKELEKELRSEQAKVFVMGEVLKPGSVKYQVEDGMTLAEAISDAGSFREETVDPKGIFVIRKESHSDKVPTVYQLPISSVESIFFAEQFDVRPRDIVYVTAKPSIRWNRVLTQLLPSLAIANTFRNFN